MSRRESDFEWAERQEAAVRGMQPERSVEFAEKPSSNGQIEFYRKGWLDAVGRESSARLLANRVLEMKLLDQHQCPSRTLCIYCDAINLALEIAGRNRAR